MNTTHKFAIASALGIGLMSAVAFSGPGGMGMGGCGGYGSGGHHGMMGGGRMQQRAEMMQQRHSERMELLKYRLELTPEQEAAWENFIQAQNNHHESMWQQRPGQGNQQAQASFTDHFDNRIQFMEQRLSGMKEVAQAADDLYTQLDPEQQQTMDDFIANRPGAKRLSKTQ
jgi:hypothetical protein